MMLGSRRAAPACWVLGALFWTSSCSSDKAESKRPAQQAEAPAEAKQEPSVSDSPRAAPQPTVSAQPEVEIDPARMPVEEDFVDEAKWRIGKSAKLEKELNRIAAELKPASK